MYIFLICLHNYSFEYNIIMNIDNIMLANSLNSINNYISSKFQTDHTEIVVDRHIFPSVSSSYSLGSQDVQFNHMYLAGNVNCDGEFIGKGSQIEDVVSSIGIVKSNTSQTLCSISNVKYIPSLLSSDTFFKIFNLSIFSDTNVVVFSAIIHRIYKAQDPLEPSVKTTHGVEYHLTNSYFQTNTITSDTNSITFNGNTISFDTTNNDPSTESISVSIVDNYSVSVTSM